MNVDHPQQLPTVLSFCSGYAGLERGLDLAGVEHRVLAYVEIEAYAIANLVDKMEAGILAPAPIFTDLKQFPAHIFRGCVDLITGGYPCQPFSAAGKRGGESDPRHLWPFIEHHIREINPGRVLFENVEGHISLGLPRVLSDLEASGYEATWGIFSASEAGAPHQRKRVYIMADSVSQRESCGPSTWREIWHGSGDSGAGLADADGRQCAERSGRQSGGGCEPGDGSEDVADSQGLGVQGLRAGGIEESDPHGQTQLSMREGEAGRHAGWHAEPAVDRVVDGFTDRVDRIRLLGNGVVPQTAAIAWRTLDEELELGS